MGRAESDSNKIWIAAPTRVAGILMTGDESDSNKSVQNQRTKGNKRYFITYVLRLQYKLAEK